ncbi:MAG: pyridoxal 5'-phosphate synthase glutaminase subunit PdxT [Planctomycetes bacterium]|nr:pyridoxal 5'-phosphate synthase glutaminase subunit PdxT [Planctomycetota bacterium]
MGEPLVGVLAVQGDFAEHQAALHRVGLESRQVRRPEHLVGIAGLVLPGGESTTMLRLLKLQGLRAPIAALLERTQDDRAAASGAAPGGSVAELPVLGTCAGLILLAREVVDPQQDSFGVLDLVVARNGYGRQIASGTFPLRATPGCEVPADATGVFIRAPRILEVGPAVEVLAWRGDDPVLVRHRNVWASCFHPELEVSHFVTRRFAALVRDRAAGVPPGAEHCAVG